MPLKKEYIDALIVIFVFALIIVLFSPILPWDKYNLYDYLKKKRLEHYYQQQFEKHKITCNQCKGSGEYPTDVNKLMMDASLSLFINHHLMVDKCEKCVKLPCGDGYDYCDIVQNKYKILLQEYGAAGPKIDMAACEKCMGMGTFSSFDIEQQKYLTQEEYETKEKSKSNE